MAVKGLLLALSLGSCLGLLAAETIEKSYRRISGCEDNGISKGVYRSVVARSKLECHALCQADRKCLSLNVCDSDDNKTVMCSLSSIRMVQCDHQEHRDGCSYRIMKGDIDDRCGAGYDGPLCSDFAVQSCKEMQECSNQELPDGEYWIYPISLLGRKVKIYCHNMTSPAPSEYVSLQEENHSTFSARKSTGKTDCSTVENWSWKTPGTTEFYKIRINIKTMEVDRGDFTFSKTIGFPQKFGLARDCAYRYDLIVCRKFGRLTINTNGSGLLVNPTLQWKLLGHYGKIESFERSADGRKITAVCGGHCAGCVPDGPLSLQLDTTAPPESKARSCASLCCGN